MKNSMHIQNVEIGTARQPDAKALTAEWLVMTTVADWHALALDATGRLVAAIPADRWHGPTPCAGWDVRGLVSHLVSGNLWASELGAGGTIEEVGERLDGDLLGADPAGAYAASARAASKVFHLPGALGAPCAVSYGPVPGSVYAGHRFIDVMIHGWDLATSTGQDSRLDDDLAEACRKVAEPQIDMLRASGAFGESVRVAADASAQARLLAMLGRRG
jgi:uncharacterized protein (TIGR03086 family)